MPATKEWKGGAALIAQVVTLTLGGTWEANDVVTLTMYDEAGAATVMNTSAGSTVIATICTTLAGVINAVYAAGTVSSPFYAVQAAAGATTVTLTARAAGVPFYLAAATTETGGGGSDGQTVAAAVSTANSGPNDWNTPVNWSDGVVPGAGDTVWVTGKSSAFAILHGLFQNAALTALNSITLALLKLEKGHPQVGTLDAPLTVKFSSLDVGDLPADRSSRSSATVCNLKPGNVAVSGIIRSTRNAGEKGRAPVQIGVSNSGASFVVQGAAIVGFGTSVSGEAGMIGTITVKETAKVAVGSGVMLSVLNPEGGETNLAGGATTINYGIGAVNISGSGNVNEATIGGKCVWESSGTVTNLYVAEAGEFRGRKGTIASAMLYGKRARIIDDSGVPLGCAFPNGVAILAGASTGQVDFGDGVTVTPTAL